LRYLAELDRKRGSKVEKVLLLDLIIGNS